jgi:carbonic anhydrase/acetyltransferase-like protein (isoleucine patch superfamily)
VGDDVTIGHMAVVHGCTLHDRCLIGIGATVLDQAVVHNDVMVAAGAVVTPRSVLESGYLYAGIPAKRVRALTPEEIASFASGAAHYAKTASTYKQLLG